VRGGDRHATSNRSPAGGPTAQRLVFTDFCCLPLSNIRVMRPDGGGVHKVTHLQAPEQAVLASYSPDGRRLVLDAFLGPDPDTAVDGLYTMPAGGGPLVPVFKLTRSDLIMSDWGPAR
jgi:hypothetical protein